MPAGTDAWLVVGLGNPGRDENHGEQHPREENGGVHADLLAM